MAGSAKTSSSSRDWRAQSRPKAESAGVKYARRIVVTLLLAALAAALTYLIMHRFGGQGGPTGIHIAVVPVSGSGVLTVPPVPFAKEDSERAERPRRSPAGPRSCGYSDGAGH